MSIYSLRRSFTHSDFGENHIHGIKIGGHEIKLSACADDTDFLTNDVKFLTNDVKFLTKFLTNDVNSLRKIFSTCTAFQSYSSLELNLEKSESCWNGAKQGCSEKLADCKWIDSKTGAIRALVTILMLMKNSIFLIISKHWRMSAICGNTVDFLSQEKS